MKTLTSFVLLLLSLVSFGQNCDCNTINILPECRKKCGPLILSKGSEKQVEALAPNLPKPTIKKVINAPERANKISPKDFKNDLTLGELSIFESEYNNWETVNYTITQNDNKGTTIGVMNGGTVVTNNYNIPNEKPELTNNTPNLRNLSGTWVGTFDVDDQADDYTMVMDVKVSQNRIHGSIKLNWNKNNYVYALFSFNGTVENDKVTIDENTATQVYGTRTWFIKQYVGILEMDGDQIKLSGRWNNDSHKLYDWGHVIISGSKSPGGNFELTKLKK